MISRKTKVLITTISGVGQGHVTAAQNLKNELVKNENNETEIIDLMKYQAFSILLTHSIYSPITKYAPILWEVAYKALDRPNGKNIYKFMEYIAKNDFKDVLTTINRFKPDHIIHTHCSVPHALGKFIQEDNPSSTQHFVLTDYGKTFRLNAVHGCKNIFTPDNISKVHLAKYVDNTDISDLGFPTTDKFYTNENNSYSSPFNILIIIPNALISESLVYCKFIFDKFTNNPNVQIDVVCGKNKFLKLFLKTFFTNKPNNIFISGFRKDIDQLLKNAHVCITKPGGATLSESMQALCPLIIYKEIPGQEEENRKFIIDNNIGWQEKNPSNIAKLIQDLIDTPTLLEEKVENIKSIRKHNATKNIIEKILGESNL